MFEWILYESSQITKAIYGSILIFTEGVTLETYRSVSTRIGYCLDNRLQVYKEKHNKTVKLWSYLLNLNNIFLCQEGKEILDRYLLCERHDSPFCHGHETLYIYIWHHSRWPLLRYSIFSFCPHSDLSIKYISSSNGRNHSVLSFSHL